MADPRLILGRIVTINGTTPGPASGISYTIAVHDPATEGVYRLERQAPLKRWPDDIDVEACEVGSMVIGTVSANRVQWHFHEYPAFAECPNNLQNEIALLGITQGRLRQLPREGQGQVGDGSQAPTPPDINPD